MLFTTNNILATVEQMYFEYRTAKEMEGQDNHLVIPALYTLESGPESVDLQIH